MEHPAVVGLGSAALPLRGVAEVPPRRAGCSASAGLGGGPPPPGVAKAGGVAGAGVRRVSPAAPPRSPRPSARGRAGDRPRRQLACPTPRRAMPASTLVGGMSACSSPFEGAWSSELSPPSRPSTAPVIHALPYQSLGGQSRLGGHEAASMPTSQSSATLPLPASGRAPRRSSNPMCRDVFFARGLHHSATYGAFGGPSGAMCVPSDGGGGGWSWGRL
ncbi:hypothetical protein I4F81_008429 [Pyropia yezoensis]|uniref:Uncharacterized protein n=1 Tax=Pyropia yezoensis TaxID=2788 RepID=A0ACC3C6H8_PYRYE|nr:hypothetical protein I4F81_008429 [Neopyropia yezoensis]